MNLWKINYHLTADKPADFDQGVTKMSLIVLNQPAPNFTLDDVTGNSVSLSQFKGKKHVILVLNRGFV